MAPLAAVTLALLLLEDDDLITALVLDQFGTDAGSVHPGRAETDIGSLTEGQNIVDFNGSARFSAWKLIDDKDVTLFDGELSALGLNCRFHKR